MNIKPLSLRSALLLLALFNFAPLLTQAQTSALSFSGHNLDGPPINQTQGWTFAGTTTNTTSIPTGYDHQVDGQTFLKPPLPTRNDTWGGIKRRYR